MDKKTLSWLIVVLLISISMFTIGYVIYRFFFWQPPIDPLPFQINISNFAQ